MYKLSVTEYLATLAHFTSYGSLYLRDRHGRTLMLHSSQGKGWQPVGGDIDKNEMPWDGARREGREEIGLDLEPGALLAVVGIPQQGEWNAKLGFYFDGGILTDEQIHSITLDPQEHDAFEFRPTEGWYKEFEPYYTDVLDQIHQKAVCGGTTLYTHRPE